ncbi:MAG: O-unit flippase-like protein [Eubacteriales bacterium]
MGIQITRRDVIWSYASYILQTGAGFFLLPVILNRLPSEELAIWYVFLSITALVNLLDFGLQPTIMRNVSYIFSGARTLKRQGVAIQNEVLPIDYALLKSLIKSIKRIYMIISFVIAGIMFSVGSMYIRSITDSLINQEQVLISWNIYVLSIVLNFYFYYYTPLLTGRGRIAESNQTIVMSKLTYIFISAIGLLSGYGLIAVSIGNLVGSLVNRITSFYFFYDKETKINLKSNYTKNINLLPVLWSNAYRMGLVSVGAFLITKGNTLIASKYLNLEIVAQYGLTLQVTMILSTISSIFFRTHIPKFNNYRMIDDLEGVKKDYGKSLLIMNSIYFLGALVILIAGNIILNIVGSNTMLLPETYTTIILIIIYLETNHSNCATLITTKNEVPFVKASLLSGAGVLIFGLISVKYLELGILGLLLSQGFVQLAYNNWKWPKEAFKDMSTNYFDIIKIGCLEWKNYILNSMNIKS